MYDVWCMMYDVWCVCVCLCVLVCVCVYVYVYIRACMYVRVCHMTLHFKKLVKEICVCMCVACMMTCEREQTDTNTVSKRERETHTTHNWVWWVCYAACTHRISTHHTRRTPSLGDWHENTYHRASHSWGALVSLFCMYVLRVCRWTQVGVCMYEHMHICGVWARNNM